MKKALMFFMIIVAVIVTSCKNNPDVVSLSASSKEFVHQLDTANYTTIQWIDSVKNFDTAVHGEKVKIVFHFVNSGDKPLFLAEVTPTCGCTVADYTKSAVLPGKQGEVTAIYDSNHGQPNQPVRKTITVRSNVKNEPMATSKLVFTGFVKAKAS